MIQPMDVFENSRKRWDLKKHENHDGYSIEAEFNCGSTGAPSDPKISLRNKLGRVQDREIHKKSLDPKIGHKAARRPMFKNCCCAAIFEAAFGG